MLDIRCWIGSILDRLDKLDGLATDFVKLCTLVTLWQNEN